MAQKAEQVQRFGSKVKDGYIDDSQELYGSTQCGNENFTAEETNWLQMPQEELAHKDTKPMHILVIGKTGTGKSSLINSFLGQEVANVNDGANPQNHEPIEVYRDHVVGGHSVTVADTRGLGDPDVSSESILENIKKFLADSSTESFDLVWICVRLDDRIDEGTIQIVKKIASVCGSDTFWERVVIVLTFTNMFEVMLKRRHKGIQKDELFKKIGDKIKEIGAKFNSCISGVPFEKIPHVCAGWSCQEGKLSTSDDWRHDLFFACSQMCSKSSKPVMKSLIQKVLGVLAFTFTAGVATAVGIAVGTNFFPDIRNVAGAFTGSGMGLLYKVATDSYRVNGETFVIRSYLIVS